MSNNGICRTAPTTPGLLNTVNRSVNELQCTETLWGKEFKYTKKKRLHIEV